jgi:hypothetical protein
MKMDVRLDTVFSTRDEQHHAELKAKESGGVSLVELHPMTALTSAV